MLCILLHVFESIRLRPHGAIRRALTIEMPLSAVFDKLPNLLDRVAILSVTTTATTSAIIGSTRREIYTASGVVVMPRILAAIAVAITWFVYVHIEK